MTPKTLIESLNLGLEVFGVISGVICLFFVVLLLCSDRPTVVPLGWVCLWLQTIFQEQVEGLRWQEFERRRREREEKLAEIREIRHAERVLLRKRAFYQRQAEAKAIAEKEEEERRKKEGECGRRAC